MKRQIPEAILAGFEKRVDAMFRAEAGKPLVRAKKRPPLAPERGKFVRSYSYSIVAFAARCLYLGEMLDEANAALIENAQYYLDNPKSISDRDSFHWHAEIVLRLIEMYGTCGSKQAGWITKETEDIVLKPIWLYAKSCSWLSKAEVRQSKTWHIYSSENHHVMDFTIHWHFSKLAKDLPTYRNLMYDDGAIAEAHYQAWDEYFVAYCLERARKSPCVEMMNEGYNGTLIRGFYNFYDFGDPQVQKASGQLLDLYFAYWAQEQIHGVQGGGRSRIYFDWAFRHKPEGAMAPLAWLYFGMGKQPEVRGHDVNAALSNYRPPAVVADIALDVAGRGRYEVQQRSQGLGKQGHSFPNMAVPNKPPNKLRTDGGGILRYSYCDPAFIIGTPMTEARPSEDWVKISTQNRWQGVIFAGKHDARIVPIPRPENHRVASNQFWSVQCKGSLITQKLKFHESAAEMIVWMSNEGLSEPVEENGIVFVEAEGAYAAVRVVRGGFEFKEETFGVTQPTGDIVTARVGRTLFLDNEYAPVILEVMAKSDMNGFDTFKKKVKSCEFSMVEYVLKYRTVYEDELTFDTSYNKTPTINGKPVNYAPKKVFESPFLNADYNSGIVTISKGKRKKVLEF